jgi:hypothetical protein
MRRGFSPSNVRTVSEGAFYAFRRSRRFGRLLSLEVRNGLIGRRANGWNVLGLGSSIHDGLLFRLWEQVGVNDGCVSDLVLLPRPAFFLPCIPLPLLEMGEAIDAKEGDGTVVLI